ncbi:MAG: AbiH family protein [Flagellimonas sp.]
MNKLVIVGNGLDLAHGLPTSYNDFIDDYWSKLNDRYEKGPFKDITYVNPEFCGVLTINTIRSFKDMVDNLEKYCSEYKYYFERQQLLARNQRQEGFKIIFQFKNSFFKILNQKRDINRWVDIESEYYMELKKISKHNGLSASQKNERALKLNEEFNEIKSLLINYLNENVEPKIHYLNYKPDNPFDFCHLFKEEYKDLENNPNSKYLKEFRKTDHSELIEEDYKIKEQTENDKEFVPLEYRLEYVYPTTLFLNFNYTNTLGHYQNEIKNPKTGYAKVIHIHGQLSMNDNLISFGFGDEMDEDYNLIENLDDNEFLKNFKSFFYLQNQSYKELLDFIDSRNYQIYIMGHSCGLSDRVLLNTIFEHENCRSIKVFYHKRTDGTDNFTEIIQNISRHFKQNVRMREKIVDKSLSEPFPQNIRFVKK